MSDLKLVAPDQPTPLERLLLDAAANESPSAEQRMRVRQALGLSAVSMAPPPAAQTGRGLTLGKTVLGVAIAGSAVVVALLFGVTHKPAPLVSNALPAAAPAAALNAARNVPPEPVASPLPALETASDSRAASSAPAKTVAKVAPSASTRAAASSTEDLSEQLRLIDAARTAVAAGNTSAASQALATYSSKFPRGSFGQEAAVLRIETVDMQGNHTQAASLARTFLAAHPNSPHVGLVKRIAGN